MKIPGVEQRLSNFSSNVSASNFLRQITDAPGGAGKGPAKTFNFPASVSLSPP